MLRHLLLVFFWSLGVLCGSVGNLHAQKDASAGITVDKAKRTVTIDAKVAPRKLPHLDQVYPIEVIACRAYAPEAKEGNKAHETVVTTDARPSAVHKALEDLGLKPGKPAKGEGAQAQGPEVRIYLEIPGPGGQPRRIPIERTLVHRDTGKPLPKGVKWHFTGSVLTQPDPTKTEKVYGADRFGTLIAIFPVTDETVVQSNLTMREEKYLKLEIAKEVLPKEGTPVKLVIEASAAR